MDDYDGQIIFGVLECLKFHDICLTGEEKPRKHFTQKVCPDQGSHPGPRVRDAHATACSTAVGMFSICRENWTNLDKTLIYDNGLPWKK